MDEPCHTSRKLLIGIQELSIGVEFGKKLRNLSGLRWGKMSFLDASTF